LPLISSNLVSDPVFSTLKRRKPARRDAQIMTNVDALVNEPDIFCMSGVKKTMMLDAKGLALYFYFPMSKDKIRIRLV
jgi:hypothetical protein